MVDLDVRHAFRLQGGFQFLCHNGRAADQKFMFGQRTVQMPAYDFGGNKSGFPQVFRIVADHMDNAQAFDPL